LPDGAKQAGHPVSVSAFGAIWDQIREKTDFVARLEDAWGKAVPCHVSTPTQPANRTRPDNARSVCLIPREPLKKKALYRAYFEIPLEAGRRKLETYFVTEGD
ncbi:MAG TPA: hypothetical protein VI643_07780, partial [Planctomycetota bacterium]|nr:hypothetical protein [Planctomycetota bacterium]